MFNPWVRNIPWKRERLPSQVSLPGEFHGERSQAGYSPWGRKEVETTKVLTVHRHLGHHWVQSLSFLFSSVTQLCPTLFDPMDCSMPGPPVHHKLPGFTQTLVHWICDPTQPSPPLSSPFLLAFDLSQHQGLFKWVRSLYQVAKVLKFQLQHQSLQWTFRTDGLDGSPCSPRGSQESSPTPQFKSINSSTLSFLHSPSLTLIHDHWKSIALTRWIFVGKVMSLLFNNFFKLKNRIRLK